MGMKSKGLMIAAMASMFAAGINQPRGSKWDDDDSETKEEKERRLRDAELERKEKNGLKEFDYPEGSVWALNKKNADRKAKKLGYTL